MDYARAGYSSKTDYEEDREVVRQTLAVLADHFGVPVKIIKFNPASSYCWAMYREKKIKVGMALMKDWGKSGYREYKTLQYIIGLKWKRGEWKREAHKTLIGKKAIQAIMCHEYAHLLSYERWGATLGRNHQIMFQATVAEVYDFMFGADFGATDRFLDKKGDKWLVELTMRDVLIRHENGLRGA